MGEGEQLETILTEEENNLESEIKARIEYATTEELSQEENRKENRDYLGEMALAAQLMITGGEKKEIEEITRQDRYWILKAVVLAAE